MGTDFYVVLGVSRNATLKQIKNVYKKLAFKHHPDKNIGNKVEAEKKFKEIGRAYEVLSNKETRSRYDTFGEEGLKGGSLWFSHRSGPAQGAYSSHDAQRIFEQMFGSFRGFGHSFHSQTTGMPPMGMGGAQFRN